MICVRAPHVHCSKLVPAIWYVAGVLVPCCVVIFTSEMMYLWMVIMKGDGSHAEILFYMRCEIQEVATMDLVV